MDSTINRAHQHGTNLPREKSDKQPPAVVAEASASSVLSVLAGPTGG